MANVNKIRPTIESSAPNQSISICNARLSAVSDGMVRYDVIAVMTVRIAPMKKYHAQVVYRPAKPAKNITAKKPKGAQAP